MPKVIDWNELMRHQLCSFGHGSYVYGCERVNSDIDSVVIVDDSVDLSDCQNGIYQTECMYDMIIYDTQFINDSTFRKMIDEHHIIAIESMWMPKDEYCEYDYFMKNYFPLFKLDKWKLRQTISAIVNNSWAKCHKKLTVPDSIDVYRAKKSLFHCFRLYDFGRQIATYGKITDYSSCNSLLKDIMNEPDDWNFLKEKYQPLLNSYRSSFVVLCPKP